MTKINMELLRKLSREGFFKEYRTIEEIVERLAEKGFTIKGKKVSLLSQLLTFICREGIIERKKDENGKWKYKNKEDLKENAN
jgi:ribosomal protein S8